MLDTVVLIIPTLLANDQFKVLLWGLCWVLAGLFLTRQPREQRRHFFPPALAVAGHGDEPIYRPFTPAVQATVNVDPWPAPAGPPISTQPPTEEMTMPEQPETLYDTRPDEWIDDGDTEVGDVMRTSEAPILEAAMARQVRVIIDIAEVEDPGGDRAIFVDMPDDGRLTAAEAAHLARRLSRAQAIVAGVRQDLGFQS